MNSSPGDKILQQDRLIVDGEQYVLPQQNPVLALKAYSTDKVNWKKNSHKREDLKWCTWQG